MSCQKLWVNVAIHFNADKVEEIQNVVLNALITITLSLIANFIKCKEDGVKIEFYRANLTFRKDILSITKSSTNPSIASDLTRAEKLWYQLIITNSFDYIDELYSNNNAVQ